jgi:hypothetical protein
MFRQNLIKIFKILIPNQTNISITSSAALAKKRTTDEHTDIVSAKKIQTAFHDAVNFFSLTTLRIISSSSDRFISININIHPHYHHLPHSLILVVQYHLF